MIREWSLPDSRRSLPLLQQTWLSENKISNILRCLSYFNVNIQWTLKVYLLTPICHCTNIIMWLVGSKPIRSNVACVQTSPLPLEKSGEESLLSRFFLKEGDVCKSNVTMLSTSFSQNRDDRGQRVFFCTNDNLSLIHIWRCRRRG